MGEEVVCEDEERFCTLTFKDILAGTLRNSGDLAKVVSSLTAVKRGFDAIAQACRFSCVRALFNI